MAPRGRSPAGRARGVRHGRHHGRRRIGRRAGRRSARCGSARRRRSRAPGLRGRHVPRRRVDVHVCGGLRGPLRRWLLQRGRGLGHLPCRLRDRMLGRRLRRGREPLHLPVRLPGPLRGWVLLARRVELRVRGRLRPALRRQGLQLRGDGCELCRRLRHLRHELVQRGRDLLLRHVLRRSRERCRQLWRLRQCVRPRLLSQGQRLPLWLLSMQRVRPRVRRHPERRVL